MTALLTITNIALLIVFILLIVSEVSESFGFGILVLIAFVIVNYFTKLIEYNFITWNNVALYFLLGFMYTIARIFFEGRKGYKIEIKELKEDIARWWILFPISLVVWIFSDLLEDVYNLIWRYLEKFFQYIYNLGNKTK